MYDDERSQHRDRLENLKDHLHDTTTTLVHAHTLLLRDIIIKVFEINATLSTLNDLKLLELRDEVAKLRDEVARLRTERAATDDNQ